MTQGRPGDVSEISWHDQGEDYGRVYDSSIQKRYDKQDGEGKDDC